jgi:hypothetical protein
MAAGQSAPGAYNALRRQLAAGERVLWIGQPNPLYLRSAMSRVLLPVAPLVAFPMLMIGVAGLRLAATSHVRGPSPYPVLSAIVVLLLFFLAALLGVLRRVQTAPRRRHTLYAVTDRRVLRVVRHRGGEDVTAVELSAVPAVSMRTRPDGSGTIAFGSGGLMPQAAAVQALELYGRAGGGPMAFMGIPDAAKVADLIRDLRERRRED